MSSFRDKSERDSSIIKSNPELNNSFVNFGVDDKSSDTMHFKDKDFESMHKEFGESLKGFFREIQDYDDKEFGDAFGMPDFNYEIERMGLFDEKKNLQEKRYNDEYQRIFNNKNNDEDKLKVQDKSELENHLDEVGQRIEKSLSISGAEKKAMLENIQDRRIKFSQDFDNNKKKSGTLTFDALEKFIKFDLLRKSIPVFYKDKKTSEELKPLLRDIEQNTPTEEDIKEAWNEAQLLKNSNKKIEAKFQKYQKMSDEDIEKEFDELSKRYVEIANSQDTQSEKQVARKNWFFGFVAYAIESLYRMFKTILSKNSRDEKPISKEFSKKIETDGSRAIEQDNEKIINIPDPEEEHNYEEIYDIPRSSIPVDNIYESIDNNVDSKQVNPVSKPSRLYPKNFRGWIYKTGLDNISEEEDEKNIEESNNPEIKLDSSVNYKNVSSNEKDKNAQNYDEYDTVPTPIPVNNSFRENNNESINNVNNVDQANPVPKPKRIHNKANLDTTPEEKSINIKESNNPEIKLDSSEKDKNAHNGKEIYDYVPKPVPVDGSFRENNDESINNINNVNKVDLTKANPVPKPRRIYNNEKDKNAQNQVLEGVPSTKLRGNKNKGMVEEYYNKHNNKGREI